MKSRISKWTAETHSKTTHLSVISHNILISTHLRVHALYNCGVAVVQIFTDYSQTNFIATSKYYYTLKINPNIYTWLHVNTYFKSSFTRQILILIEVKRTKYKFYLTRSKIRLYFIRTTQVMYYFLYILICIVDIL